MRLHEIAARSLADVTETVVVGDGAEPADVDALLAALRLPHEPVGVEAPVGTCRLLVVPVADPAAPAEALAALAGAPARRVLVALAAPAAALPLGPLVDALVHGGWAVREAAAVEHPAWASVVVADRVDAGETPSLRAYLDPERAVPLEGGALLRLLDEHLVEGLVSRARLDALQSERDALAAEVAVLRERAVADGAAVVAAEGTGRSSAGLAARVRRGAKRVTGR